MPQTLSELVELLDLEEIEVGLFRARQPDSQLQRAFGGQVLAQALTAAYRTAPSDRLAHSLHGYFLLPGRTDTPIVYDVETVRDGGSFSSRRVVARQGGKVIFYLSASFHVAESGFDHADPVPADVPAPEDCPELSEVMAASSGRSRDLWEHEWGALDVRYIGDSRRGPLTDPRHPARARVWIRTDGELDGPPALQHACLAYASDLTLLSASVVPHGVLIGTRDVQAASLDHAMWFHRPVRADQWLLYDQVSPSASGGLGLSTARLFQRENLVADVAQEGLIRPTQPRTDPPPEPRS